MKASYISKAFPLLSLLAFPTLQAQNVILTDDMTDTFYAAFSFNGADSGDNPADLSFADWQNGSTGGNPGAVFNLFHEHDVEHDEFGDPLGDPFTNVQSFFENGNMSYTPSTQGTISTLTFSLDIKTTEPIDSLFFIVGNSTGSSVAQDITGIGFLDITADGEWQTITLSGVTQAGLLGRDLAGSDPLDFGFGFTSSGSLETFSLQADNFVVNINPIPEPSSALLIALGLVGLARRRR